MTQKHKFTKAEDEIKFRNDIVEIAGDFPNVAMILDPEYFYNLLEKYKESVDPKTTILGIWNTIKDYSQFISDLANKPKFVQHNLIKKHIYLLNHILTQYNETHNDIVKAINEFRPTIVEQINELEKLLFIGSNTLGKKRKFPHIVKSHLAAILANEKTSPGSPVFAYKKSQLTKIAFELFRDEKGKKFTKKESFHTMLNQRCKYNPKQGVIVKDYLQINKDVIETF